MNAKLQLMPDLDALGVRVLQTPGQCVRHIQVARELVSLGRLVDDFDIILVQSMLVCHDRPCDFVRVANIVRVFRVEGEVVAFNEL